MNLGDSLDTPAHLQEYCSQRFGLEMAPSRAKLICHRAGFSDVALRDPALFIKTQLICLHMLPAGCQQPREIKFSVTLHLPWVAGFPMLDSKFNVRPLLHTRNETMPVEWATQYIHCIYRYPVPPDIPSFARMLSAGLLIKISVPIFRGRNTHYSYSREADDAGS